MSSEVVYHAAHHIMRGGPRRPGARALARWRHEALGRMARSRRATLALLRRLPAEARKRPGAGGAWSVKDVLVHVAAWEEEGTRRLRLIARGRGARIVWYDTRSEMDRFNARVVRAARHADLPGVLARLTRARAGLVAALAALPPRALADPTHALPVTTWLREFAWTHERGHRRTLRAWPRTRRRPPPRG